MRRGVIINHTRSRTALHRAGALLFALLVVVTFVMMACRPAELALLEPVDYDDGAVWTNSLGMKFLHVPSKVSLLMSAYETRVKDFRSFIDESGHDASSGFYYYENLSWKSDEKDWRNPGFNQSDDYPVVGISWNDAVAFCHWLTEQERGAGLITAKQTYRLPTDQEWTSAAYPAMAWPYPTNTANYHIEAGIDKFDYASPVGSFPPNRNGFYDLAGNAWEYCLDRVGPNGDYRTIRGGSWQNWHAPFLGTKARGSCSVNVRISIYGFRVVLADADENLSKKNERKTAPELVPPAG